MFFAVARSQTKVKLKLSNPETLEKGNHPFSLSKIPGDSEILFGQRQIVRKVPPRSAAFLAVFADADKSITPVHVARKGFKGGAPIISGFRRQI